MGINIENKKSGENNIEMIGGGICTLNFTLCFPEFLQLGKVFVENEDFGQADGRHFPP